MAAGRNKIVNEVLTLIKGYWPSYTVPKPDLLNPTSEFVKQFYIKIIGDMDEKFAFILNECPYDELANDPKVLSFDHGVYLYGRMYKFFHRLPNVPEFTLSDIYQPTPKRTLVFMRIALHYLIFLNNNMEEVANVVNAAMQKQADIQNLEEQRQQHLATISQNAETLGELDTSAEALNAQLAARKTAHEAMSIEKKAREKAVNMEVAHIEKLRSELDTLWSRLQMEEEKEASLQEQVVTEKEMDDLRIQKAEIAGEIEAISLEDKNMDEQMEEQRQQDLPQIQNLIEIAKGITLGDIETGLSTLEDTTEKHKSVNKKRENLEEKLENLRSTEAQLSNDVAMVKQQLKEAQETFVCTEKELEEQIKILHKYYETKREEVTQNDVEYEELQGYHRVLDEEVAKLKKAGEVSRKDFTTRYKTMLDRHQDLATRVNEFLSEALNAETKFEDNDSSGDSDGGANV